MLDGSLIVFVALKLGVSCPEVFSNLAMAARHRAVNDRANVSALAEVACQEENPDDAWVAAYLKAGFQTRVIMLDDGKTVIGVKVDKLAETNDDPAFQHRMAVGVFQLNPDLMAKFGSISASPSPTTRLKEALPPATQMRYLVAQEKPRFASCGSSWLRCWALGGTTEKEQEVWRGIEIQLARSAARLLTNGELSTEAPSSPSATKASPAAPAAGAPTGAVKNGAAPAGTKEQAGLKGEGAPTRAGNDGGGNSASAGGRHGGLGRAFYVDQPLIVPVPGGDGASR